MFIAIESPPHVKDSLKRAQDSLRNAVNHGIRWTNADQFHLTLKFLGNVPVSRVEPLAARVTEACRGFGQLRLRVEGVDFFPNARSPRVIWAGVTDEKEQLRDLWQIVAGATAEFSSDEKDKEFRSHITLGRVKQSSRREAARLVEAKISIVCTGEWEANRVSLIRSELSSAGPRYTIVAEPALV